ncbi:hypothetical protein I7I50_06429 [Histoplasma capsulatum G186AR]|uniref:Uncharacterized protein n=1 Tax=Ajellomyces capsulatus TaxID=5037 RepID=A0A8H7YXT1_AJECA|nr:hypothetical protein I7I52_10498 [Histoplasma capsulatum]QSS67379.1 hypothetical protein I7I50_06429 [Histoplasma capsulatum G186AR]
MRKICAMVMYCGKCPQLYVEVQREWRLVRWHDEMRGKDQQQHEGEDGDTCFNKGPALPVCHLQLLTLVCPPRAGLHCAGLGHHLSKTRSLSNNLPSLSVLFPSTGVFGSPSPGSVVSAEIMNNV